MARASEILEELVELMVFRALAPEITSLSGLNSGLRIDLQNPVVKKKALEWTSGRIADLAAQIDEVLAPVAEGDVAEGDHENEQA